MTDLKALAEAAKAAPPGTSVWDRAWYRFREACTEDAILALYAERDEVREMYAREGRRAMIAEERASATEASLASYKEEVERLKIALADAIRRPMGVIPASAEGLITYADVDAAEARRSSALTKEPPHAEC